MTAPGHAALRQLALTVLARRAGPAAGAKAIAAAADRAYDDLVRVLATYIGGMGVKALTDRALHLAKSEYSSLVPTRMAEDPEDTFAQFIDALKRQDPAVASEGAAAVFATLLGLLATFIGEPLAARLVRQAWPDALSGANTEGT
jgi:hypothetical protein